MVHKTPQTIHREIFENLHQPVFDDLKKKKKKKKKKKSFLTFFFFFSLYINNDIVIFKKNFTYKFIFDYFVIKTSTKPILTLSKF